MREREDWKIGSSFISFIHNVMKSVLTLSLSGGAFRALRDESGDFARCREPNIFASGSHVLESPGERTQPKRLTRNERMHDDAHYQGLATTCVQHLVKFVDDPCRQSPGLWSGDR
jgi:hypothetical protein